MEQGLQTRNVDEDLCTVSQGTLIGIDQLVLGATTSCDLLDLEGRVVIPTGAAITPRLLKLIKSADITGLIAAHPDFVSHHVTPRKPTLEVIASRITEMQRRSGITRSLTSSTCESARSILRKAFSRITDARLPDLTPLQALTDKILHDTELLSTAPLPSPENYFGSATDQIIDGAIDMAVLLGWHLRKEGVNLVDVHAATLGGLLHDAGLLLVSNEILNKPGPLTRPERREVERHPYLGLKALSALGNDLPKLAQDIILLHHEHDDGSGYPLKRSGDSVLPIISFAHIIDSFIAIVSPRPYRKPAPPHRAVEVLLRDSGRSFNQEILRKFIGRTGRYPLGSAVMLNSSEVGVVVGIGKGGPFRPIVDVYFSRRQQFSTTPQRVDLGQDRLRYISQVVK